MFIFLLFSLLLLYDWQNCQFENLFVRIIWLVFGQFWFAFANKVLELQEVFFFSERPDNNGSKLFSGSENAIFFSHLGYDCYSLAAGIVQLLKAETPNQRVWTKYFCGVISLVKDYGKRAYFLRLYDVFRKELKWQQMLYVSFFFLFFFWFFKFHFAFLWCRFDLEICSYRNGRFCREDDETLISSNI